MKSLLPLFLLALLISPTANAGLSWRETNISIKAKPTDTQAVAVYHFTNKTNHTITIKQAAPSCGCTVANLSRHVYKPGESGEIKAIFSFGIRKGHQEKRIYVSTSDNADSEPTVLSLSVDIPQLISIKPYYLFWKKGSSPEPKTMTVTLVNPKEAKVLSVKSQDHRFKAVLKPTANPKIYHITITPDSTQTLMQTVMDVHTNFPPKSPHILQIYAGVK